MLEDHDEMETKNLSNNERDMPATNQAAQSQREVRDKKGEGTGKDT